MAAAYQLAWDGYDGMAFSGVIKADGTWVPCAAENTDWDAYQTWVGDKTASPPNKPDPWRAPADGGVAIKLAEGQEAVGSMLYSLPPPAPPVEAASATVASTGTTTSSTRTTTR